MWACDTTLEFSERWKQHDKHLQLVPVQWSRQSLHQPSIEVSILPLVWPLASHQAAAVWCCTIDLYPHRLVACHQANTTFHFLGQFDLITSWLWMSGDLVEVVHTLFIGQAITMAWPRYWLSKSANQCTVRLVWGFHGLRGIKSVMSYCQLRSLLFNVAIVIMVD